MAIKMTLIADRPNTAVDWYEQDTDVKTYINTHFISTGKMVQDSPTISADGLTKTMVKTYPNNSDRIAYQNEELHPLIKASAEAGQEYGFTNNIKRTLIWEVV